MKNDISSKQKILLVFFGIVLTLIFLEGSLRAGGFLFSLIQQRRNLSDIDSSEVRILCLGESTTALGGADSYPAQLEAILNAQSQSQRRFKVINAGMVSKNSQDILEALPRQLQRYQPQMIVVMMGINDKQSNELSSAFKRKIISFFNRLRTVQLFCLLTEHIKAKGAVKKTAPVNEEAVYRRDKYLQAREMLDKAEALRQKLSHVLSTEIPEKKRKEIQTLHQRLLRQMSWILVEMGREMRLREEYPQAMNYLQQAMNLDDDNYGALVEFGRCLKEQGDCRRAVHFFNKAFELNPKTLLADMEMASCLNEMGMKDQAAMIYDKILNSEEDTSLVIGDVTRWFMEHDFDKKAHEALNIALEKNSEDYDLNKAALAFYIKHGEKEKTLFYQKKVEDLAQKITSYFPHTIKNYNDVLRIAALNNLPVICMQYPLRDVEPLKKIFWTYQPAIFVENRNNFGAALEKHNYFELFSDSFAGDFGHCTRKGNQLIAENLARAIMKEMGL